MERLLPYEKLYIYTIHGRISPASYFFGDSLLSEWEDSGTTLLFFESPREKEVRDFINGQPEADFLSETVMDYKDWEAGRPVTATRIGGFLVCPTWDVIEPEKGEIRILLDPGVAFGSGFHPTTKNSLLAIEEIFKMDMPEKVLDLGCGTGILSVAALKLGARSVTSVDYASMAYATSGRTFKMNGIDAGFNLVSGDVIDNLHHDAELIISNIYIQVIEKLFKKSEYFNRKWIVISGIHGEDQHQAVTGLIENSGRKILRAAREENWYTYITALCC